MMQLLYCAKYAWYRGTEVLFNTRYHANSLEHIVPHMQLRAVMCVCYGYERLKTQHAVVQCINVKWFKHSKTTKNRLSPQ